MPRDLPTGLVNLLKSGFAETHSTLAITLIGPGRALNQTIYLATAAEGGSSGAVGSTAPAITIPNAGFETPICPASPGYISNPTGASWTFNGAGVLLGSLFGAAPAYEGAQGAFLSLTGSILQALTGFVSGTNYEIRFRAAQQIPGQATHDFDVYMDAILLGRVVPPAGAAFQQYVFPFTAGQAAYTLKFQGVNTAGGNVSSILDAVQIVPVAGLAKPGRGVDYLPRLRSTGPVAMSLARSADRVDVVVENIDRLTGNQLVAVQDALYGSFAEFGRLWRDLRNPQNVYQVTLLTGQVVAARASETEVQLTLMSDIYSSGAIAGQIIYGRSCPWTFKDAATCAYVGPLATCNKLLDSPDGCSGRANEFHFGGFPYIKGVDTISGAAALQANVQYQTIIQPAALSDEELERGARATTAIIQRHNLLLQGFTITDSPADDATKIVAGGVGGANYQTLKENDGYSFVRTLPPQPTLNFLNSFKLTDDPGNLETDITTYGVPTGQLNLRTDKFASGSIDVTTVATFNIAGVVTVAATLNLQPGMGVLVEGAGAGGADFVGTVGAVSADGKTYVLTAAFAQAPPSGARVQADDTAAVQAWFNAKGDLAMPPGYYRLTSSIVVPTTSEGYSIIVHGSGWDLSVFAFQHGGDGFVPTAPDLKIDSLVFKDVSIATGTKWDTGGLIDANNHGFGLRMTAPTLTGIYNDCVLERCRVIGWGRFGILSDNAEVCWITQCIFRVNRHGHIALLAPDQIEAPKQPNANTLTSCTFDQAFGGGDAQRSATGAMTAARPVDTGDPPLTQAEIDAARTLNISGVSLTQADRGRLVIVSGVGTNVSNLYSFIDVVLSSSSCRLGHDCRTTNGAAPVTIFSSSVASIFLNRAHDTVIDGATIQGNFTNALTTVDCNAIRADGCANLRIVGVHEEDAGGVGGAAVRLENCQSVTIENWGGTSAGPPAFTNAHGADFQLINTHGVRVAQAYFNDRPQFNMDGNSDAEIDNSLVTGHNNLWQGDASWERLKIGSGVRTYQAADARTNQTAGNEYMYDGLLAREVLLNSRFIDAPAPSTTSWTTAAPTYWSLVYNTPERFDSYLRVNATAEAAGGGVKIFSQTVAVPDSIPAGSWILGVDWYIESDAHITAVGAYVEVRLKPSVGVEETLQWSSRAYTYITQTWQVGQVKAWLGAGTGRTIEVQINVTPGPSNPVIRLTNFRLTRGKHSFGAWARPVTDFGGKMRAPLEFEPIAVPPAAGGYPPPATGSPVLSLVNIAGTMNIGKNGAYVPITPGGPGTITGPPDYYAIFNTAGTGLDYGYIKNTTPQTVRVMAPLLIDRTRPIFSTFGDLGAGPAATLAVLDSTNVCYFGPEFNAAGTQAGSDVVIRAAHGDVSSLQIAGAARRMTFNVPVALAGITGQKPTFFLGISDLSLDGLRIQPLPNPPELFVGYMLSCFQSDAAPDAMFAVDQKGDIVRINNKTYAWPANYGAAGSVLTLQNATSGALIWAPSSSGAHIIQEESVPLPARPVLNFVGLGFQAQDIPPPDANPRTNVTLFQASIMQEGVVSTGVQDFGGRKHFRSGLTAYDSASVPIVAQYTGGTVGASIQEWWITGNSTPIASLNTQPYLRLGIPGPGGRAGFLELCSDTGAGRTQLGAGLGQTATYNLLFPLTAPVVGSFLQVLNAGGQLTWSAASSAGHVILEDGVALTQRPNLNFQGSGFTAFQDPSFATDTVVRLNAATATLEGIVSSVGQTFGGRKTFNAGAVMQGLASTVPVLTIQLSSDATSTARLQEWRDPAGSVLGYYSATALHLGAQGFLDGMLELASASSANFTSLRAATFPAASLIYVLPIATPTPGQVLGVDTIFSGTTVNLIWKNAATGAGNVTVTAPQGTDNRLPRWTGTSPAVALEDSAIEDRTTGGSGTVEVDATALLLRNMSANEVVDFYMRTPSNASTIWRYERRAGGSPPGVVADSANSDELQLHFGTFNANPLALGPIHSWFQGGVRIRPLTGTLLTVGNALEIRNPGPPETPAFYVTQAGNLQYVFGIPYVWPGAAPALNAVLKCTDAATGTLAWVVPPTGSGSVSGTGTFNYLPRVQTASPYGVLQDSGISDDNVQVILQNRYLQVWNKGGYAGGADLSDIQLKTTGNSIAVLRYECRTVSGGGIADDVNYPQGEFQVWLQGNAKPTLMVGTNRSYFTSAIHMKPPASFGYAAFEVDSTAGLVKFQVMPTGNMTTINGLAGYVWPTNHGQSGSGVYALANDGVGNLTWRTWPTGTGSGANIQLSNLDATGNNVNPSVSINTHLGFSVDGGWNIGAPTHRVGSMYLLGTFFMYPAGSTNPSSPRAFGFLDPAVGEYTRVLLSGNAHVAQGGNGQRLQFTSYHSFEFRGNRRNGAAPGFTTISGTDSSSLLVYLDRSSGAPDCIPLLVNTDTAAAPITSDLFVCQNAGTTKFRVGPQGSIVTTGGTRHRAIELQYPANSTIAVQADWRTIIVDTVNGPQTLTLPSAQANPGMIIDIIHMKAVQQILSPLNPPSQFVPGYDAVVNVRTTGFSGGSDVFNAWPIGQAQATSFKLGYPGTNGLPNPDNQHKMVKLIADEWLAIWWLMPYYL